ncbi:single-stranded DNA-binding protein [Providencia sp. JGM181]|jgi:single-strand DNA-binding protein|uniref:single-stranded DNA-binding protein n=1 Tax=unclassified Providencia TaxID=2633465 RepID=UPI0012B66F10|nr:MULTISPECIES: single-stranded DNA-binding protein [unclassified Providencia]MBS0925054.1 single-stranded DNA-binding protein [Providencia sp. JGM181]MBS0933246.1 single-stranded DNA-binding protein [Providencia sp. JGM172]MBS0997439.1 single-stranded DNA-binding protein [Providencia sp. JGM178]MTB46622.1 single-stranded DNA-binding protein [Providencia sp. wls1950]MTC23766.1 single-stranded DNA-binding protein [Providencia sp. wls1938]
MASRGVCKVILIGYLGNDPIVRYAPTGTAFASFSVATSEIWNDRNTGEQRERTDWHNISIQGKLAEIAGEYLRKGSQVYIEGKLRTRKYQGNDGQEKNITEVFIGINGTMQMLGSNSKTGAPVPRQRAQDPMLSGQSAHQHIEPPMDFDDDIPF